MIKITSDYGQIFGLKWFNTIQQIDLTAKKFDSPCGRFSIAKAVKQSAPSTYWGGCDMGRLTFRTTMSLSSLSWIGLTLNENCFVKVANGGLLTLGPSGINGAGMRRTAIAR
jgi:hypothetical protein